MGHKPWHFRPWNRHSIVLAISGMIYVGIGISWQHIDIPIQSGLWYLTEEASITGNYDTMDTLSHVWIFVGILALISSVWPKASGKWGYASMSALAAGWSVLVMVGVATAEATFFYNLPVILTYLLLAFLWWAISGLAAVPKGGDVYGVGD